MGALDPSPRQFGQQRNRPHEVILSGLLEGEGSAQAQGTSSYQYAEREAEARCINYLWGLAQRMANQLDPRRCSDFLPRWEAIYGITPLATDSLVSRRAKILAKQQAYMLPPTQQVVTDLMSSVLGSVFLSLVVTPSTSAIGACTNGATIPGGVTLNSGNWGSTIAHLLVLVQQPAAMPNNVFMATVGQIRPFLDDLLPAWVTLDWAIDGAHGDGFYLDEPNLNRERFL